MAVAVGFAGCGRSNDAKPSPTTRTTRFPAVAEVDNKPIKEGEDACGLVTRSEVESAVSLPVNPGDGVTTKGGNSSCAYRLRSGANQYVGVIVQKPGRERFDSASSQLGSAAEALSGVGERAFVANDTVYAMKGDRLLILQVLTAQPVPARKQAAIKLSQSAIGKV